ncbi:hypothetical protein [Treponema sp.]|uniref:hypothetical protein n=1 Tax=Treponema sp. TaxID=166 RepID=UPI003FA1F738
MIATKSPVLQMLNEKIDVLTLSPTERKPYESRMKLKSDITTISLLCPFPFSSALDKRFYSP